MEWTSPNFRNGAFHNQVPTELMTKDTSFWRLIFKFFRKPPLAYPSAAVPTVRTDLKETPASETAIIWFGHSSYLVQDRGLNILVDPVFSGNASPVPFTVRAFQGSNVYSVKDLPDIDILIITHNHYDHLDAQTIRRLRHRVKAVYTALGVGRTLRHYGMPAAVINEMDWGDRKEIATGASLTSTPARHFSGRSLRRNGSLWSSFVYENNGRKIFIGGDSGYGPHFREIGEKYGPFDLAILEAGQYNPQWPNIHMNPEDAVQASTELKAKVLMPVHWGKFALAFHAWNEPPIRAMNSAAEKGVRLTLPRIGEQVILDVSYPDAPWWT